MNTEFRILKNILELQKINSSETVVNLHARLQLLIHTKPVEATAEGKGENNTIFQTYRRHNFQVLPDLDFQKSSSDTFASCYSVTNCRLCRSLK